MIKSQFIDNLRWSKVIGRGIRNITRWCYLNLMLSLSVLLYWINIDTQSRSINQNVSFRLMIRLCVPFYSKHKFLIIHQCKLSKEEMKRFDDWILSHYFICKFSNFKFVWKRGREQRWNAQAMPKTSFTRITRRIPFGIIIMNNHAT